MFEATSSPAPKLVKAGQTVLHYRVESTLGAGGMGVVYRAQDTRLKRPVALKILSGRAAGNPEWQSRLIQEARSASALNHPNIVTIYDAGSETVDGATVDFIAMEYVAGKTLDRVIGKGLKLNAALKLAIQIADAIATAHAAGIVHRDLKPANLIVNDQACVKVLDFGLAKLADPQKPDAFAQTESVRLEPELHTESGTILGTVAYMSPEQAEGKTVDARSDIFSFGTVLYEMVTGRRAFAGDSKLSILATILQKDPPPVRDVVRDLPLEIDRIVSRCLQKDPRRRWQSMPDVKFALEELLGDVEANRLPGLSNVRTRRRWMPAVLMAGTLAAASIAYLAGRAHTTPPATFERLTFRRGDINGARFAPDGRNVIYSSQWDGGPSQIYSTVPGNRESRSLGLPEARLLGLSNSGELAILLGSGSPGTLARVPLAGGSPRELLENVTAADWSPNGADLAVIRSENGRHRVEYPIGKVLYETAGRPPYLLRVSPKGNLVAFFDFDGNVGDFSVAVAGPDTPKRALVSGLRGVTGLAWAPSGDEVWFSAANAGADPWVRAVTLGGKLRNVVQAPGWVGVHDIGSGGRVLMQTINSRTALTCNLAPDGRERDVSWLDASYVYELSPDAKRLLFVELSYGEGRNVAIYIRNPDGSPAVLLGFGNRPALSPDAKWVVAIRTDGAQSKLLLLPTGAGETRTLSAPGMRYETAEWFPDGKRILFTGNEPGHAIRTYVQSVEGGAPRPVTAEGVTASKVSPDGQFVVETGGGRYQVARVVGGAARNVGPAEPGERPLRWSADGRGLFLRRASADGGKLELLRLNVATGEKQVWKVLSVTDSVGVTIVSAAITPDGNSYAYSYQRDLAELYLLGSVK